MTLSCRIPLGRQIRCVKREISQRERCYPHWVIQQRMTQDQADAELAAMKAVLETLKRVNDQGQGQLFDES